MSHSRETYQEVLGLMRAQRFQEARDRLEVLLKQSPDDLWFQREYADALLRLGDTSRAGPILRTLLASHPDHPRILTLVGERHRLEGRHAEAAQAYLEALRIKDDAYVRTRAIDALLQLERFSEAGAYIEGGLRQRPDDAFLLRRRARWLEATDQKGAAAAAYAEAARVSSSDHPRDYAEAVRLRLEPLPPDERPGEVLALLELETHRSNPFLHALYAELLLELGRNTEAGEILDRATALAADDPHALKSLGFLFNRLKRYDDVLTTLGRAFVAEPRDIVAQQVLFAAARKAKKEAQLRTLLVLAYDRHPGFHKLNGLLRKLDKSLPTNPDPEKGLT